MPIPLPSVPVHTFRWGDQQILTQTFGTDAGMPIVLVHGIGLGRRVLLPLTRVLSARHRVTVLDLPGFGDSPRPRRALDLADTGRFVARVAEACAGPHILIGHSMGAQVVAEAARLSSAVRAAVLIGLTVDPAARTVGAQLRRFCADLLLESPGVLAVGGRSYLRTGPIWFVKKLRPTLHQRIEDVLPAIPVPTLVLVGSRDRVSPVSWSRAAAALLPVGTLSVLPGKGHETMIRDPLPAAKRIEDFLSSLESQKAGRLAEPPAAPRR
ncbi:MAG: alpha/beta hydrolase [Microbacteriaceae bacterium]|nr:alpha/beta hydrolase [Microbacteriaceae bacterium]